MPHNRGDLNDEEAKFAKMRTRYDLLKRIAFLAMGAVLIAVVVLQIIVLGRTSSTTTAIRDTQQTGSPVLIKLTSLNKVIVDCVNPNGKCYKDGQARTAAILQSVNDIITDTAACTDKLGTQSLDEIRACVIGELTKDKK